MAKLTRIQGSENLVADIEYTGKVGEVSNNFDSRAPFSGIQELEDLNGNKWVRIPKFYRAMDMKDGFVSGRQLSEYKVGDNWTLSPCFVNNAGAQVGSVEIGKYQLYIRPNGEAASIPGVEPAKNTTPEAAQAAVDKLNALNDGYEYFLMDIWTLQLIQDLFVVEFANSSSTSVMPGCTTYFSSKLQQTGVTDTLNYCSGYVLNSQQSSIGMKYRGIENIYGNGIHFIDKIKVNGTAVIVEKNGETVQSSITANNMDGMVHKLAYDAATDLVLPKEVKANGSYGDYASYFPSSNTHVVSGLRDDEGYGIFSLSNASRLDYYTTYRIVRRLK